VFLKKRPNAAHRRIKQTNESADEEHQNDKNYSQASIIKSNLKNAKKQNRFKSFSNKFDDDEKEESSEGEFDAEKFQKFKATKAKKLQKQEKKEKRQERERDELDRESERSKVHTTTYSREDLAALRSETKFRSFVEEKIENDVGMVDSEIIIPSESQIKRAKQKRRNVDSYISLNARVEMLVEKMEKSCVINLDKNLLCFRLGKIEKKPKNRISLYKTEIGIKKNV